MRERRPDQIVETIALIEYVRAQAGWMKVAKHVDDRIAKCRRVRRVAVRLHETDVIKKRRRSRSSE